MKGDGEEAEEQGEAAGQAAAGASAAAPNPANPTDITKPMAEDEQGDGGEEGAEDRQEDGLSAVQVRPRPADPNEPLAGRQLGLHALIQFRRQVPWPA